MTMISFDHEIAAKYGIGEAIFIQNFSFWIKRNIANNKNYHEGYHWTYMSSQNLAEKYAGLFSLKTVQRILKNLTDSGLLITGNFNTKKYDRTKWYAFRDESTLFEKELAQSSAKPFGQNGEMACENLGKAFRQSDQHRRPFDQWSTTVLPEVEDRFAQPIPDIYSDNKKDIKTDGGYGVAPSPQSVFFDSFEEGGKKTEESTVEINAPLPFPIPIAKDKWSPKYPSFPKSNIYPSPAKIKELWNSILGPKGLRPCSFTSLEYSKCMDRTTRLALKSIEGWTEYFTRLGQTEFLLGQTSHQFKAEFGWAIKLENVEAVFSDKYTDEYRASIDWKGFWHEVNSKEELNA